MSHMGPLSFMGLRARVSRQNKIEPVRQVNPSMRDLTEDIPGRIPDKPE
jgi:hypothetical protein